MNSELVIKVGAVIASFGTIFLVIFAIVLLSFLLQNYVIMDLSVYTFLMLPIH